jgi:two-component system, OmpR family, phosphate regulon sensor histidine kinase PhoR
MFYSIRWRIGLPFILLILAVMLVLGIYVSNYVKNSYLSDLESNLRDKASLIGDSFNPQLGNGTNPQPIDTLAKHWSAIVNARVTIIGADGTVLGESQENRTKMDNHSNRPEILQARSNGWGSSTRFSDTVRYDMLYVAVRIKQADPTLGFVRLAIPLQRVQENIRHIQWTIILATLITSLLAALLAIWIASSTTRPLRELIRAADQMASGRLDNLLIPSTHDEIGNLTHSFNQMAAQLKMQIDASNAERGRIIAVLNTMNDGVIIVNAENNIQLINPAALTMFNIKETEALGRTLIEAVRQYQVDGLLEQCRKTEQTQSTIIEIPARQQYLQATATPLGKVLPGNTLLLFQNLTRLRRLETIRQDFISNISHELRTPLASLKALTETLQDGALEDPPAAKRFLERMETEVDAITQMVEELLELSRIESGRVPLKLIPTPSNWLLIKAVERLSLQAERAGLSIEIQCPDGLPKVLADPSRLEQVIVNLLHNAIKFTSSGGSIILSANIDEGNILFAVKDTGIGIPVEDLPRIFERFYKTDRARSSGGTGLGLAIARHLIEAHGGKIWAESSGENGSTFYFTVPIADQV